MGVSVGKLSFDGVGQGGCPLIGSGSRRTGPEADIQLLRDVIVIADGVRGTGQVHALVRRGDAGQAASAVRVGGTGGDSGPEAAAKTGMVTGVTAGKRHHPAEASHTSGLALPEVERGGH